MSRTASPVRPRIRDPRRTPDFEPALYPVARGPTAQAAGAQSRNERVIAEFSAVYYWINRESRALAEARRRMRTKLSPRLEAVHLRRVEKALRARDALEDFYAPHGVIAEPVMRRGLAESVEYTFGNVNRAGTLRSHGVAMKTFVSLPLSPAQRREMETRLQRGPGW